jgi:hypothetical protein
MEAKQEGMLGRFFLYFTVTAKPTPLDYVTGVYLIISLSFFLVSAAGL